MGERRIRVGCAGWQLPQAVRPSGAGTGLARYAQLFNSVEINSTFKAQHRPATFERWASTVPAHFRFAIKAPKAITHDRKLVDCSAELETFVGSTALLGTRLGPLLFQFAPSLAFDIDVVKGFLDLLRTQARSAIVFEPRHPSWSTTEAQDLLSEYKVARAATDPKVIPNGDVPGGSQELLYFRLHGSPRTYFSSYSQEYLSSLCHRVAQSKAREQWVIFDNTAAGAAAVNALSFSQLLADTD